MYNIENKRDLWLQNFISFLDKEGHCMKQFTMKIRDKFINAIKTGVKKGNIDSTMKKGKR